MKVLKWFFGILLTLILVLVVVYVSGPKPPVPDLAIQTSQANSDIVFLADSVTKAEASIPNLRHDNESRIIFADSIPQKTEYSIVYLHGFSASQEEGDPIHEELAARYGCNLFLPRLAGHGLIEEEAMLDLKAEDLVQSAYEAIAVGKQLGEKVILLTTSTGGTLGLYLAQNDPEIAGILLYSPNVDIFDPTSKLLTQPWGLQMARQVTGSNYYSWDLDSTRANYWTNKYRLEVLIQLRHVVDITMVPETFQNISQPVFLGYYYKSDAAMDSTVSVPAMLEMYEHLGTLDDKKVKVAFPEAKHHVIASYLTSKDLEGVRRETFSFMEDVIGLTPKPKGFDWLLGDWERTNDKKDLKTFEKWVKINSDDYHGLGFTLEQSDTVWKETMQFIKFGEEWEFKVTGQGETTATVFKVTDISENGFTCKNEINPFPKSITYTRNGNSIEILISGGGESIPFVFAKME
ncbi:MAG: alpha/beta fold hydrolase [Bacteroidota bacterium]